MKSVVKVIYWYLVEILCVFVGVLVLSNLWLDMEFDPPKIMLIYLLVFSFSVFFNLQFNNIYLKIPRTKLVISQLIYLLMTILFIAALVVWWILFGGIEFGGIASL